VPFGKTFASQIAIRESLTVTWRPHTRPDMAIYDYLITLQISSFLTANEKLAAYSAYNKRTTRKISIRHKMVISPLHSLNLKTMLLTFVKKLKQI
jgi:hypothetical protein